MTVVALYERGRGELGLLQLLELFEAHGVPRSKIEAALVNDPDGRGALRDRITADMANRVLADLGAGLRQTPADVKTLRKAGGGASMGARPPKDHR